jgi:hypothetical protein
MPLFQSLRRSAVRISESIAGTSVPVSITGIIRTPLPSSCRARVDIHSRLIHGDITPSSE